MDSDPTWDEVVPPREQLITAAAAAGLALLSGLSRSRRGRMLSLLAGSVALFALGWFKVANAQMYGTEDLNSITPNPNTIP